MKRQLPLLISLILMATSILMAQPRKHNLHFGCKYALHDVPLKPLSDAEKNLTCGSNARSDSIDVLNYAIELDLTQFGSNLIGACEVRFTPKEDGLEALPLDLLNMNIDSVMWQGMHLSYDYNSVLLDISLPAPLDVGDTTSVTVYYHGLPTADPSGFGGFVYDDNIGYNLGIGLASNPYNFGRSWHPCFDNFVERATYDIALTTNGGRTGYAIGELQEEEDLGNGKIRRAYRMDLPLPTYLVGVAASNYVEVNDMHAGAYGDYPILLVGKAQDSLDMVESFEYLPEAIDALEAWFGPYAWGQVGYVMTTAGAMEHSSLIAYPDFSIGGGPTFGMNRLMAHELAHHWWGNVTTLSCPENMWIKEGNAEYGAHLFNEYTFGREFFDKVVKDNHYDVLQHAHEDDGGIYHPLSGIPYEYTYGTHTYNKGASVMHNLRGYLGDSLFHSGMSSVLENFEFESIDAEQMRDHLTEVTGVNMSHFFNVWIYGTGFATYELDSVHVVPSPIPEQWEATVYIQQKLHHAASFHLNAPVEITFYDANWNAHHVSVLTTGEFSEAVVVLPFEPVWQVLNDRNKLNLARMQDRRQTSTFGDLTLRRVELVDFQVVTMPEGDSAMVSMIHQWVAPDTDPNLPVQMSSTHYWRYGGIFPDGFKAKTTINYRGISEDDFDFDLVGETEDSLILVWRPDAATPWGEFPYYRKLTVGSSTDGNGFIRIDTLLAGDYAFANGSLPLATATGQAKSKILVSLFPNPAAEVVTVQGMMPAAGKAELTVFDALGKVYTHKEVNVPDAVLTEKIAVENLPPGMYWLSIRSEDGEYGVKKFVKK